MAIVAYGIHTGDHDGRHHPRRFDRLFNTFDRYGLEPNHPAWVFATVSLKLHIDHSKFKPPAVPYDSFRDCLNSYVDLIAEAEHKT